MASILKSRHFVEGINTAQAEVFNWEDVASRAKLYLETVKQEGHRLLAEAREEATRIREAATANGVADGQSQLEKQSLDLAQKMAREQVTQAMATLQQFSQQLEQTTQHWLRQWQHETIPLAIAIAEKLVARQIESDPEILMQWIEETIRLCHNANKKRLRMHPNSIARLQPALDEWLAEYRRSHALELVPDEKIHETGVVLESSDGVIDMQLPNQLARLREELAS